MAYRETDSDGSETEDSLEPLWGQIDYGDVLEALGSPRYGGRTEPVQTGLHHSLLVKDLLAERGYSAEYQMHGLLNGAAEAVIDRLSDQDGVLKEDSGREEYRELEDDVLQAVYVSLAREFPEFDLDEMNLSRSSPGAEPDIPGRLIQPAVGRAEAEAAALEPFVYRYQGPMYEMLGMEELAGTEPETSSQIEKMYGEDLAEMIAEGLSIGRGSRDRPPVNPGIDALRDFLERGLPLYLYYDGEQAEREFDIQFRQLLERL